MTRENDDACVVRSPHGAKRNAGFVPEAWLPPDFASLHPGYEWVPDSEKDQ